MKIKKHYLCILSIFIMMMASAAVSAAQPESVNLAEGKQIISNNLPDSPFSLSNLTDGDTSTMSEWICTGEGKGLGLYAAVDLGDEYNITSVQLYGRQDQDGMAEARYGFEIQFSNTPDFESYESVNGPSERNDTLFPPKGSFSAEANLTKQYRYVRLIRTQATPNLWLYYNDLKVMGYGDVYEKDYTLVSEGKKAVTDKNYPGCTGELALNDKIDNSNRWLYYGNEDYHYMIVDLEKPYNIGYLEVEKCTKGYDTFYENTYVYGCNEYNTEDFYDADGNGIKILDETKYKVLARIGKNPPTVNKIECDDSEAFRYLIYRRIQKSDTELGGFRAYVVNPKVVSYTADSEKIVLKFSADMDSETLTAGNIELVVDGKAAAYTGRCIDNRKYEMLFDGEIFDSDVEVKIKSGVKGKNGSAALERTAVSYTASEKMTVSDFGFYDSDADDAQNITEPSTMTYARAELCNNSAVSKQVVYLVVAAYDSNNTIAEMKSVRREIQPTENAKISVSVDTENVDDLKQVKAYLWRDCRIMADCVPSIKCEKQN